MIASVFATLSNPYVAVPLAIVGVSAIVYKVASISIPKIKAFGLKFYNSTFITNLRSLNCSACAQVHKSHGFKRELELKLAKRAVEVPVPVDPPVAPIV